VTDTPNESPSEGLLERAKFFRDHVQAVMNLATGALVLSVTFIHDKAEHLQGKGRLRHSWELLGCTILLGVAYNYVLAMYMREKGKRFGSWLPVLSFFLHAAFAASIVLMALFGLSNI
jgi:hypothetical protein